MNNDKNSHQITSSGTTAHPEQTVPDNQQRKTPLQKRARISYEQWLEKYRPIKNPFDSDAPFEGCMFETYGADLEFVHIQPARKIWTLLDCDGKLILCEGFHYVNRHGYFISEVDFPADFFFSIKAD
jgi:hypothetical protein